MPATARKPKARTPSPPAVPLLQVSLILSEWGSIHDSLAQITDPRARAYERTIYRLLDGDDTLPNSGLGLCRDGERVVWLARTFDQWLPLLDWLLETRNRYGSVVSAQISRGRKD